MVLVSEGQAAGCRQSVCVNEFHRRMWAVAQELGSLTTIDSALAIRGIIEDKRYFKMGIKIFR